MPTYMTKFTQTAETWNKLISGPEDRRKTLDPMLESIGGKLHGLWYAFGEADGYLLFEAPDDVTCASALMRVASTGAFTSLSTTKLLTVEEAMDAMGRAGGAPYRPPGYSG